MSSNINILNPTYSLNNIFNFTPNFNHFKNCKFDLLILSILDIPFSFNQKLRKTSDICSICLESITFASKLDLCSHIFCKQCINKWKKINKICPLCRAPFKKLLNYTNHEKNTFNSNNISEYSENVPMKKGKINSHKLSNIILCDVCKKYGNTSYVFTFQICKKYNVHFWCEETKIFQLGIFICPSCNELRNSRLNEN